MKALPVAGVATIAGAVIAEITVRAIAPKTPWIIKGCALGCANIAIVGISAFAMT